MTILILLLSGLGLVSVPTPAEAQPACETDEECYALCLAQDQLDCDADFSRHGRRRMRPYHEETAPPPRPVSEIVESLSDNDRKDLREWSLLAAAGTLAAGGVGQTCEQHRAAVAAWDALTETARAAYHELMRALEVEYIAAREDYRAAYNAEPPEDPQALLGPDWPGFPYLPVTDFL